MKLVPSRRWLWGAGALALVAPAAALLAGSLGLLLALDAVWIALLLVDAAAAPTARALELQREVPVAFSLGRRFVVRYLWRQRAGRRLTVLVKERLARAPGRGGHAAPPPGAAAPPRGGGASRAPAAPARDRHRRNHRPSDPRPARPRLAAEPDRGALDRDGLPQPARHLAPRPADAGRCGGARPGSEACGIGAKAGSSRGCASGSRATTPGSSTGRRRRGEASRSLGNTRTSAGSRSCCWWTRDGCSPPRWTGCRGSRRWSRPRCTWRTPRWSTTTMSDSWSSRTPSSATWRRRGGRRALRAVLEGLAAAEGRLVESDYPGALRYLALHSRKRALTVLFTDVIDRTASEALVAQAATLRPASPAAGGDTARPGDGGARLDASGGPGTTPSSALPRRSCSGAREAALTEMRSRGVMVLDVLPEAAASALVERYYLLKQKGSL